MSKSKRQQIVDAIDARLKTILISNGYGANIGKNVFEWRDTPFTEAEMPGLTYRDTSGDIGQDLTIGSHRHDMNIDILIFALGSTELRKSIADAITAIGSDITWGGLAEDTTPKTEDVDVDHNERKVFVGAMSFTIKYTTERFNPYR